MIDVRLAAVASALLVGTFSTACDHSPYLGVDLTTDYAAGIEYDAIEVSLDELPPTRVTTGTGLGDRGRRVFERDDVAPGAHAVEVSLRLGATRVAARRVQFSLEGSRIVTVVIGRSCRDVVCPTTGATECLGGRCVAPECTTLGEPGCSEAECSTSAECAASVACAEGACVEGACLEVPIADACGTSTVCVPERGCVARIPVDAGGADAGAPADGGTGPFDGGGGSGPFPPVAPASQTVWTVQDSATPPIAIGASDADGDIATYEVRAGATPTRGSVRFVGDSFVYTPSAGVVGSDAFTLRVTDTGGRFVDQVVSVTIVAVPSPTDWTYTAREGEAVTLGGSGNVTGTNGFQEIGLTRAPGLVRLDPSFNRGNDVVRVPGDAADWRASTVGSNATLTDGSSFAQIPVGSAGLALVFNDGIRSLRTDASATRVEIGAQFLTDVYLPITAPAQPVSLPGGLDPGIRGQMVMSTGGTAIVGGATDLIGTNGSEAVVLLGGDVELDPSFNRGGDTIELPGEVATFQANLTGSYVRLVNAGLVAQIPVGASGVSLVFTDATRTLLYDGSDVLIGAQVIGTTAAPLTST